MVSMQAINGIRTVGVPCGTKWINIWWILLIHPNILNLNHSGKVKESVKIKCLVLVKIYGISPRKLLNIIIEDNEMKVNVLPLLELFVLNKVLNSL
jgi:uncharacterized membrane protein